MAARCSRGWPNGIGCASNPTAPGALEQDPSPNDDAADDRAVGQPIRSASGASKRALSRQAPRLSPWWATPSRVDGSRKELEMPDLIWIIVIVLVVLLVLGYFGRGRFRR